MSTTSDPTIRDDVEEGNIAIQCHDLAKDYGVTRVLNGINLSIAKGKVTALIGENGAGKSTLLNILAGLVEPSAGQVSFFGNRVDKFSPNVAQENQVQIVTQELSLVPDLKVWENLFLGHQLYSRKFLGAELIDIKAMVSKARELLSDFGVSINPRRPIRELSLSYAQVIEILKAINRQAKVLLLDEPTSALTETEVAKLFQLIERLKRNGVTIIFTSHKMGEIREVADRIVVLRDGSITLSGDAKAVSNDEIIKAMVGRSLEGRRIVLPEIEKSNSPRLRIANLSLYDGKPELNIEVYPGEVVGLAGIAGAGRSSLLQTIYGLKQPAHGDMWLDDKPFAPRRPSNSIALGVAFVPEDRKESGLVLSMSVIENTSLAKLGYFTQGMGVINSRAETNSALEVLKTMNTKFAKATGPTRSLSGGNQQKVLLSRWLVKDKPLLLLLDEPTRGIDVGAKAEIYEVVSSLAREGVAIMFVSSELPELMLVAHRILVLRAGGIAREFTREEYDEEVIIRAAIGEDG